MRTESNYQFTDINNGRRRGIERSSSKLSRGGDIRGFGHLQIVSLIVQERIDVYGTCGFFEIVLDEARRLEKPSNRPVC